MVQTPVGTMRPVPSRFATNLRSTSPNFIWPISRRLRRRRLSIKSRNEDEHDGRVNLTRSTVGIGNLAGCHPDTRVEARIGKTGLAIRLTEPDVPPIFVTSCRPQGAISARGCNPQPAAVFISAPPDAQDGAHAVAAAFGLTAAETKVPRQPVRRAHAGRDRPQRSPSPGRRRKPTSNTSS
jgi:hypothetical protein